MPRNSGAHGAEPGRDCSVISEHWPLFGLHWTLQLVVVADGHVIGAPALSA